MLGYNKFILSNYENEQENKQKQIVKIEKMKLHK